MKIQNKHIRIAISGRIGEKCLGNKRRKEKKMKEGGREEWKDRQTMGDRKEGKSKRGGLNGPTMIRYHE